MTTLKKVQGFIARRLDIDERELTPDRTLASVGIDSLAAMELLFDIEDEFGFRLEKGSEAFTVREVAALVDSERARKCAAAA